MKTRHDERYESDLTSSREIARRCRAAVNDDAYDASLALLHYRGGEQEFALGKEYSVSSDAEDRATGADILAQLGWSDRAFLAESVEILIALLQDPSIRVRCRAAIGLGHRGASSAIPHLLKHANHPDPSVRYSVVFGLSGHDDVRAIAALIRLTTDPDYDVRNWATFGLGSRTDADSPEIREALRQALGDSDHEIRGEALVGLARRGDPMIVAELINEWKQDDVSILSIEAAEISRDPRLHHRLQHFTEILKLDDAPHFTSRLADAIKACAPEQKSTHLQPEASGIES